MYLFFDTETNGLPKKWDAPADDVNNWPRIIQFAFILFDENRNVLAEFCELIKPDGWEVPNEKFWIDNGFSTENNKEKGIFLEDALDVFEKSEKCAKYRIAHNMAFDSKIVRAEFIRVFGADEAPDFKSTKICTMKSGTQFCNLPRMKWPKLQELHEKLFSHEFENAHDALADVKATAKCFFAMVDRGIIDLEKYKTPENA